MNIFSHLCSSVIKTKRVGCFKNTFGGVKWVPVTQKWCEMSKTTKSSFSHPFESGVILSPPRVVPWGFEHDPQTDLGITWAIASGYINDAR